MALDAIMDAVAVRAATLTGLRACYSAASSPEGATMIPRSVDDSPIGIVWFDGDTVEAGNFEVAVIQLELQIWVSAVNDIGEAYRKIIPFRDRARVLFRTDLDANGTAVRVLWTGTGAVDVEEVHGKPFLTMPTQLEALEIYASTDYTS